MIDFSSRQLRGFLLVAEHRSFSRAAAGLFVTPSALSMLIRELENQIGARLFDRTTRRVTLTAAGEELLGVVRRNLQELDGAISQVGRSAEKGMFLSLGAAPLLMASIVVPAIEEYRLHCPDLRFQLFDGATSTTMEKVESGALDIGVGVFFKHLPGVRRTPLFRFSVTVIRAGGADRVRPGRATWSSLREENLIALSPSLPLQQFIEKHLARAGVAHQPHLAVNYLYTQIALVQAGIGVAVVPSYAQAACRDRGVVMRQLIDPVAHLDLSQIRRGGRRLPRVAEEFTSFLQSHIASWAGRSGVL
jgi:DNA-binding transcriptional LysR family regulator